MLRRSCTVVVRRHACYFYKAVERSKLSVSVCGATQSASADRSSRPILRSIIARERSPSAQCMRYLMNRSKSSIASVSPLSTTTNADSKSSEESATEAAAIEASIDSSRPVHWRERIQQFPKNVKKLCKDGFRIREIYNASHTANNAWTNRYHGRMGKIPRRQQEQVRQFVQDLRIVLPLVIIWIPPIIGYLPLFLAILSPRQVLSKQFFNLYEKEHYAILEMQQRYRNYPALANHFWACINLNHHHTTLRLVETLGHDAAGPIWKLENLFIEFCKTQLVCPNVMSKAQLKTLSLAGGYCQRFPTPLPDYLTAISPRMWLAHQVKELASHVYRDDLLLLEEHYHVDFCEGMTDNEVREACLLRGLPVRPCYRNMRICMTNYLHMVANLIRDVSPEVPKQHVQMFLLYVSAIRSQYNEIQ